MVDFIDKQVFRTKLKRNLDEKNPILKKVYGKPGLSFGAIYKEYEKYSKILKPYVCDLIDCFYKQKNKQFLFEGAQGTFLDVDFGTFPFVTSSSVVSGNALLGSGLSFVSVKRFIGVAKAYTTRVGEGPFPTELDGKILDYFRNKGVEFGATTGRPRRCGWLDLVLLRRAIILNKITELVITKLDVLDGLKKIKVCVAYKQKGKLLKKFPYDLEGITPVYKEFKGWEKDISKVRRFLGLPEPARKYISFIEGFLGVKAKFISVGEKREAILKR